MLNGPFETRLEDVLDADGAIVASGYGYQGQAERENAEMECAALNAVYFMAKATGAQE